MSVEIIPGDRGETIMRETGADGEVHRADQLRDYTDIILAAILVELRETNVYLNEMRNFYIAREFRR